ncbi:PRC-barrel domain-containing protein [Weizmannia acidilactici]|uniref:PRC-barrel domain-containing protein n=1 Tax=Weizmannia acidilactici TaxID=2607726 RepID=UPI00124F47CB|nr:PRC-barrel domain-containing protein [Weizmannia acidilactici]
MKKSTQILGQPIISISDGAEIGKVKSFVINPDKGSVDFLTIEHEDWQVSVKAIPFKKVIGIGEYAVTVESDRAVIDLKEIPVADQLVNKKIRIIAAKVMTRKGELLGEVKEFYVDEDTGCIPGIVLLAGETEEILSSDFIMTYGKDIIIVKEEAPGHFLDSADKLLQKMEAEETEEISAEGGMDVLRTKQVELLKGKKASKDIYTGSGERIIASGTILSEEDIVRAQEAGPGVFVELSMNVEE